LRKTGGASDGTFDGRAVSQQSITSGDVSLEFTVSGPNVYRAIGLSNDLPTGDPNQIDFAVYFGPLPYAEFRDNGIYLGEAGITAGSVVRIEVRAGRVSYFVNNVLFTTSLNAPRYPLQAIAMMSLPGGEFTDARLITSGGGACTYSIAPTSATVPAAGFSTTTSVFTQLGCAWTAQSNVPWITIASGASGSGNGEVRYNVAANTGAARTGTLTVAGQTHTVSQAAGGTVCTYALTPVSASISAAANTGSFALATQAGCGWTAVPQATWLTISGASTGVGNAQIAYAATANNGPQRTGTIIVNGATFTVMQAAGSTGGSAVQWTNLVNTTFANHVLHKSGGVADGRYDGKANSVQTIASGESYLEFTLSGTPGNRSIGLSDALPTTLNAIDYEMRFTTSNYVEFRERGVYRGDAVYDADDVFRISVQGGRVSFFINGLVFAQSVTAPPYPLRAVALMDTIGSEFAGAKLVTGRPPSALAIRSPTPATTPVDPPCRDCAKTASPVARVRRRVSQP
jgi:hypothetical protein